MQVARGASTPGNIAARRLEAQRLIGPPFDRPAAVARHLTAVQSQDYPGAAWAVAQRTAGATAAEIDAALDATELVRTHVLRPTWHLVAPEDLRWLQSLTGPRVRAGAASRYRQLEIDEALAGRARRVFERRLRDGRAATREELGRALVADGIAIDVARLTHLVMHAELEAVLCSGPLRGRRQTYALVEERLPPSRPRERDEALAELARRYVTGHGPAQLADLVWWSGLTVGDARRGLQAAGAAVRREDVGGRTFWLPAAGQASASHGTPAPPRMRLLPNFDELLVAFRDRSDGLDPALPAAARTPQVILSHVLVRDGRVVGRWRRREAGPATAIHLEPLVELDESERTGIRAAVAAFERFRGRPVAVTGLD